ncbi:MAG TPA: outer membrane beta-barrel protein, partial [Chitinophagaceae bacterium]|nr:outer membrane beta-barrel protein [Chitinophagaceae bacterium]
MIKFVLLLTSVFIISLSVSSQTTDKQKVSVGLKSGVNVSRLKFNEKIPDGFNSNLRTGFVAGAFLTYPVAKSPFSIQAEFLYSSMGGDLTNASNESQNFRFNYF